jgi:hypothetical protein
MREISMSTQNLRQLLLIHSGQSENAFGLFTNEILKAEGLNGFEIWDFKDQSLPDFRDGDLVILTRCFLNRAQMRALKSAVENGLRLVCFQPSWQLAQVFGWTPEKQILQPGWIAVEEGLPGAWEHLQTHIPIALYENQSAPEYSRLAGAAEDRLNQLQNPAIAHQKIGDGEIISFFYDLPKAIARLRFGDPERASLLNNGHWDWTHAFDMQEGFVDARNLHLPQAELHAQILAHALTEICPYPLARLWYFEKASQRAAANFSSDDDWSKPEDFADLSQSLLKHGGRGTFYLMPDTHLPESQMRAMQSAGHSFGVHINATALPDEDENWNILFPRILREQTATFRARYQMDSSLSMQCHYAPWLGYMDFVPLFMESGYRLLYNFMNHSKDLNKYTCGAGRPIKFADEHGKVFDCWQQPMQTYDDASIKERIQENAEEYLEEFAQFLRPCLEKFHSAIGVGSHPVSFTDYSKPFLDRVFALLEKENVPLYSGDDWCDFSDRRHAIALEYSQSGVQIKNADGAFTMMIPSEKIGDAKISVDGAQAGSTPMRRLERDYLFVEIEGDCEIRIGE